MGIETARNGKLLYHLTALSNLPAIIQSGLCPRRTLMNDRVAFGDIANPDIVSKRTQLGLDNYTPFHFHPYSSFDVTVKKTYSDTDFIYICLQRAWARQHHFKVLIKHPLSVDECTLYDYDDGIELIDWNTLMEKGRCDVYAKHVKMAECLTDLIVPAKSFHSIVVKDDSLKGKVESIFKRNNLEVPPPYINIQNWF